MRSGNLIMLFFICVVGFFFSGREYLEVRTAKTLLSEIEESLNSDRAFVSPSIEAGAVHLSPDSPAASITFHALGKLYQKVAETAVGDAAAPYFCKALGSFKNSIESHPRNGRFLSDWANVRQLLGNHSCDGLPIEGSYKEALSYALKTTPVDPDIYFTAGLLHYWDGERAESLRYFHEFLNYTTEINSAHAEYIVSAIQSPAELKIVVPARFPHVVRWASIFERRKSRQFEKYRIAFGEMQEQALQELTESYRLGATPQPVYRDHLGSLLDYTATDSARQMLDSVYGDYLQEYRGRRYADFFKARSQLQELERVISWNGADRRPGATQLALWGRDDLVVFDRRGSTVGFFLAEGQNAERVELHGLKGGQRVDIGQIALFVSNDNSNWVQLDVENQVKSFVIEGYPYLVVTPEQNDFRYWKLHYAGPGQELFSNYLSKMVSLYGRSSRRRSHT